MNKKLFKFALVLCASVLMAVGCQSNSKPEDDTNKTPAPEQPAPEKKSKATLDEIKEVVKALGDVKVKVTPKSGDAIDNAIKFDLATSKDKVVGENASGDFSIPEKDAIEGIKDDGANSYNPAAEDKILYEDLVKAFTGSLKTALAEKKIELVETTPIVVSEIANSKGKKVNVTISFQDKDEDKGKGTIVLPLAIGTALTDNVSFAATK